MSNDTQPEIRFPGFTDDWEERKLGDEVRIVMGQSPNSENYTDDPNDYILVQGNADMKNGRVFPRVWTTQVTKQAEKDDLILSVRAPVGDIGKTAYDVVIGRGVAAIKGNEFIFQNLGKMKSDGYWTRYSTGSTFESINSTDIKEAIISVPTIEEQNKIGSFFKQLDNTIALHQRKLDLLKETKKGFLQKMFPKNGAKVPEIRFPGFTEDWEQRKVGDFLNESRIKGSDGSVARKMTVKLWRKGVVPKEEIYSGSSATQYYIRKSGQFMYGKLDFLNQAFGIVPSELDGYESTLDSPAFDIGENMNSIFLLEYVSLTRFYKYQGNLANGSRRAKRIHVDTFLEMPIPTPSFEEQTKIGGFFKQLDDTITLHQRKLDLLKETKKGFLQKMFV
ncbi:restriction endonuclease subunit S [Enterococcus faecium]|nr:restriction endonuclease subunit S [Enterococcus faecium]